MIFGNFFILTPINLFKNGHENEIVRCECPYCKTNCFFIKKDMRVAILGKKNPNVRCFLCANGLAMWKDCNKGGIKRINGYKR